MIRIRPISVRQFADELLEPDVVPRRLAAALALATTALAACTSGDVGTASPGANSAAATTSTAPPPVAALPMPDVGEVPVEQDSGYDDAVATFGADEVRAALEVDAQVAHITLADCHRWTTGDVDPRLVGLLAPNILKRILDRLDRPEPPTLLSNLPVDDGNGNNLLAASEAGCDDSEPLRYGPWPLIVTVDRSRDVPRLVLEGSFVLHVSLGDTRVQAGRDLVLTSQRTAQGWQIVETDVDEGINWAPPLPS
jgi:hypothetical protein